MKYECVRLLVEDFDKCFKFYKDKLKLKVTWGKEGDAYASFDTGYNNVIALFKSDLMADVVGEKAKKLPENTRSKFVVVIRVDDLDKVYSEMKSEGVEFINEPMEMSGWGDYVIHLKDPEGNLIELFSDLDQSKWDKDLLAEKEKYNN